MNLQQPPHAQIYGFDPPGETLAEFKQFRTTLVGSVQNGKFITVEVDPSLLFRKVYVYLFFTPPGAGQWSIETKVSFLYQNSPKGSFPVSLANRTDGNVDSFSVWANQGTGPDQLLYNINLPLSGETSPIALAPINLQGKIDTIRMEVVSVLNLGAFGRMMVACRSSL